MTQIAEQGAFLAARLDEIEAAAKAAQLRFPGPWDQAVASGSPLRSAVSLYDSRDESLGVVSSYAAAHIVLNDPARVLREVAAKRERLALYLDAKEALAAALRKAPPAGDPATAHSYVRERINANSASGRFTALEMSVRLDAMAWSDHPDYRDEWKP